MAGLVDPAKEEQGAWPESLACGWSAFWFTPADPTVLGLVRICAGLLTLYVHLMYSFHLQEFFGEKAWLTLRVANEAAA